MGRADRFADLFEDEARELAKKSRAKVFGPQFAADLQEPVIGAVLAVGIYLAVTRLQLEISRPPDHVAADGQDNRRPACRCSGWRSGSSNPTTSTAR